MRRALGGLACAGKPAYACSNNIFLLRGHSARLALAILIAAFTTCLIAGSAGAAVFQDNGSRDDSAFAGFGQVYTEGTDGIGKYVWVVDHRDGEDVLRGFDQSNPALSTQTGILNGNEDVGPGPISSISAAAFSPLHSLLFVADDGDDRLIAYPRSNTMPWAPIDYMNAIEISSFSPVSFPVDNPRGLAIDPRGSERGYMSLTNESGYRGILQFATAPNGSSFSWIRFTYIPGAWGGANGPGAMTVDPSNGNVYVAMDGLNQIQGYTPDIDNVAGTFHSSTLGDYVGVSVDRPGNRLFGVKTDSVDVFDLTTAKLLGTLWDNEFEQNTGFAGLPGTTNYFLASDEAPHVRNLVTGSAPTCTPGPAVQVTYQSSKEITPDCTDPDGSTIRQFSIVSPPARGTATPTSGGQSIGYTAGAEQLGADQLSYTVTTQDGISATYTQDIEIVEPDTTPPTVTITSPSDGLLTTVGETTVHYTVADDRDETPECDVEDGATAGLEVGATTLSVSCTDDAGNTGSDSVTVYFDASPPTVEITWPWFDGWVVNWDTVEIEYSVNDDVDNSPECDYPSGASFPIEHGSNTFTISCTDDAGRTGTDSVTLIGDQSPPEITVTSPADGAAVTASTLYVDYVVSDDLATEPYCAVYNDTTYDGGEGEGEGPPTDAHEVELVPGLNEIAVYCSDDAGNSSEVPFDVFYDTDDPTVSITAPTEGALVTTSSIPVAFTATDDTDTSPSCNITSGQSVSLTPGANTITVTCTDDAGRSGSASVHVTYDATAPTVSITAPTEGALVTTPSIPVTFTATDDTDASPSCDLTSGQSVSLTPGANTITVTCTDDGGRSGSASVHVTYDATAPEVEITAPADGSLVTAPAVDLTFTVSDDTDSEPTCDHAASSTANLSPGPNTITVTCTDAAGRTGSDSVDVVYDASAPTVEITAPTDGLLVTDPEIAVDYSVSDDGEVAPDCDIAPGSLVTLSPGENTITVTCTDSAGHAGSASTHVTYDAAPPDVAITSVENGATVSSNTAVITYEVSDDADSAPTCTPASGTVVSLQEGANVITVTCTDASGRTTARSVTLNYSPTVTTLAAPFVRETTNLVPTSGSVKIKLPGSDEFISISEAVSVPVGTIIDAREGTAQITLANADGSTYTAKFWDGVFQVFQGAGNDPYAIIKLRNDLAGGSASSSSYGPSAKSGSTDAQIARRRKRNGVWGDGKGKFRTSGSGGSASVRGTRWYVADYTDGTLFKVARGEVLVRPTHGECFILKAGQQKFIKYKPLTAKQKARLKKRKKKTTKKTCDL